MFVWRLFVCGFQLHWFLLCYTVKSFKNGLAFMICMKHGQYSVFTVYLRDRVISFCTSFELRWVLIFNKEKTTKTKQNKTHTQNIFVHIGRVVWNQIVNNIGNRCNNSLKKWMQEFLLFTETRKKNIKTTNENSIGRKNNYAVIWWCFKDCKNSMVMMIKRRK